MIDLSIFTTPEAWISLVTLMFLEIVLGVDNLVFIAITTNRLPPEKQHIGRKLGLAGALVMRIIFLCFASYLVHMTSALFTIDLGSYQHGVSVRDLVLFIGGTYLLYKGISETREVLALTELKASHGSKEHKEAHLIGLPQAVGTIMVMDVVFSIDSVITAVGLANHLIIMIIAVIAAVLLMMVFIDQISDFINKHAEMKILALVFITVIGILLMLDGLGINSGIEVLDMHAEKLMVYFAMVFAFILELIQMAYNKKLGAYRKQRWEQQTKDQIEEVKASMEARIAQEEASKEDGSKQSISSDSKIQPIIIEGNVYIMMPVEGEDSQSFKQILAGGAGSSFEEPIELDAEVEDVPPAESDHSADSEAN